MSSHNDTVHDGVAHPARDEPPVDGKGRDAGNDQGEGKAAPKERRGPHPWRPE